jgi:glycosyltransferase involved in cell wall biosynthesis
MLLRNPFTRDARVLREARSAIDAGHEVTILCLQAGDLPREDLVDRIQVVRGVRTGRWAGPTITSTGGRTQAASTEPAANGKGTRRIKIPRGVLAAGILARDLWLDRAFIRAASRLPIPDLVHAHDLNTLAAGVTIAKRSRAKLIYDAHELYPELTGLTELERRAWRAVESRYISRADAVIVPTGARGQILVERHGIEDPMVVMNCPDPPGQVQPDPRIAQLRRGQERLFIYAGGFTPNRGLEALVSSVADVPGFRLVMLGWGPSEQQLRLLAAPAGDRVVFAGSVEPDGVVNATAAADVGIVSYEPVGLNNQLAAPNKLFEYMHAGLAMCASDLPDISRIVKGERLGEVFVPGDTADLKRALARLATADLEPMKQASAALSGRFTWDGQAQGMLEVYDRLSA